MDALIKVVHFGLLVETTQHFKYCVTCACIPYSPTRSIWDSNNAERKILFG